MICQACGVEAPTKYVVFGRLIGAVVVHFEKTAKGKLCKRCIHKYFWGYTPVSFLLGWWGHFAFILNFVIILNNVIRYLGCLMMRGVPPGAEAPRLDADVMLHLQRHTDEIINRLNEGEKLEDIAEDIGPRAGVTPGQVVLYTLNLSDTLNKKDRGQLHGQALSR